MTGDKTDGLGTLPKRTQHRVAKASGIGDVFDQNLAVTRLQHRRVVGMHAVVARKPRLLVEIDGAERQQRMASRRDRDQIPHGERIRVGSIVEVSQRERCTQMFDDVGELFRRRIPPSAGHVEMHVVAK